MNFAGLVLDIDVATVIAWDIYGAISNQWYLINYLIPLKMMQIKFYDAIKKTLDNAF